MRAEGKSGLRLGRVRKMSLLGDVLPASRCSLTAGGFSLGSILANATCHRHVAPGLNAFQACETGARFEPTTADDKKYHHPIG